MDLQRAAELYLRGLSLRKVAALISVGFVTLSTHLKKHLGQAYAKLRLESTISRAFKKYCTGLSLRAIAKRFGKTAVCWHKRFKKRFGKNYTDRKDPDGLHRVLEEHRSANYSPKDKQAIEQWLEEHQHELEAGPTKLYSEKELDHFTYQQCSRRTDDWKTLFEQTLTTAN